MLKPKDQKSMKIEAPFLDEISGLAIMILLDKSTQSVIMLKIEIYTKCSNVRYDE